MGICSLVLLVGCNHLGRLFSKDAQVLLLVSHAMPIVAASMLGELCVDSDACASHGNTCLHLHA